MTTGFGWFGNIILINGWVILLIVGAMKCLIGELWIWRRWPIHNTKYLIYKIHNIKNIQIQIQDTKYKIHYKVQNMECLIGELWIWRGPNFIPSLSSPNQAANLDSLEIRWAHSTSDGQIPPTLSFHHNHRLGKPELQLMFPKSQNWKLGSVLYHTKEWEVQFCNFALARLADKTWWMAKKQTIGGDTISRAKFE